MPDLSDAKHPWSGIHRRQDAIKVSHSEIPDSVHVGLCIGAWCNEVVAWFLAQNAGIHSIVTRVPCIVRTSFLTKVARRARGKRLVLPRHVAAAIERYNTHIAHCVGDLLPETSK